MNRGDAEAQSFIFFNIRYAVRTGNLMARLFVFVCAMFALAPSISVGADGKTPLDAFLKDFSTLQAAFEQTVLDERGQVLEVSKGMMYLQRPGKFRWDYQSPYEQTIVADGERIWVHDVELDQVTVKPQSDSLNNTPAMLLNGDKMAADLFVVTDEGEQDGLLWVSLKPKTQEDQLYRSIRLGFADKQLSIMELRDNFEQTTRIRFSDEKRHIEADEDMFSFEPPPGVDVIDASEDL